MSTRFMLDPTLQTVLDKISGLSPDAIERNSGVAASTIRKWRTGTVRSPQNKTIEFALRAAGYRRVIVKAGSAK